MTKWYKPAESLPRKDRHVWILWRTEVGMVVRSMGTFHKGFVTEGSYFYNDMGVKFKPEEVLAWAYMIVPRIPEEFKEK